MIAQEQLSGNWQRLKGKIRERWGQISEDELQEVQGEVDQLVGLIQQKTGETKVQVEDALNLMSEECRGMVDGATAAAREYVERAGEAVRDASGKATERATQTYAQAEQFVRRRPAESIAVAFGTGLIAGVIVGLVGRSR